MNTLRYRLEPAALEAEFRADALARDKRVASVLALVTVVFLLVSIPATFAIEGDPRRLHLVWTIRGLSIAMAAAVLFIVRRVESPRSYDALITAWAGIWLAGVVAENGLFPRGSTDFVAWDVFLAVATYAALPLPFSRQALLAGLLTLGDIAVLWRFKTPAPTFNMTDIVLAFACANLVGAFVSRERHGWRRSAFLALRREVAVRTELEEALREVKTLQGIIPICSFCKNIRTDAGDWQHVESYVHAHTDAQFSHGVCPDCMKLHYPDIAEG